MLSTTTSTSSSCNTSSSSFDLDIREGREMMVKDGNSSHDDIV